MWLCVPVVELKVPLCASVCVRFRARLVCLQVEVKEPVTVDSQSESTPEAPIDSPRERVSEAPQGQCSKVKRDQRQRGGGAAMDATPEKPSEKKPKVDFAPAPTMVLEDRGDQD